MFYPLKSTVVLSRLGTVTSHMLLFFAGDAYLVQILDISYFVAFDEAGGLFLWDIQIKNATMAQNRGLSQTLSIYGMYCSLSGYLASLGPLPPCYPPSHGFPASPRIFTV